MLSLSSRSRSNFFARPLMIAIAVLSIGTLAYRSGASYKGSAPAAAPIVALVNIEKVVNDCAEMQSRIKALEVRFKPDLDQLKEMDTKMASIKAEIKALPPADLAARRASTRQGAEIEGKSRALSEFLQVTIDEERADILRDIYNKTLATIEQYSAQNKIALVMADDSFVTVPNTGGMKEVNMAIIQRRLLFADKAQLDITADILTKLNNDFAAGGKAPAAPAAKPAEKKGAKK